MKRRIVNCTIPGQANGGRGSEVRGFFECWGTDVLYIQDSIGDTQQYIPHTVAVVEIEGGKVVCVPPQNITFIGEE